MPQSANLDCACLLLLTLISRFVTRSRFLYDIDSVNFAFALDHFDPQAHQPHPPGYFLYVMLGRAFRVVTGDSNSALVAISITASCATALLIYILRLERSGRWPAVAAGVRLRVPPVMRIHG